MDEVGSSQPKRKKLCRDYTLSDLQIAIEEEDKYKVIEILEQKTVNLGSVFRFRGKNTVIHLIIKNFEVEEDVMEIFEKFFEDVDVNFTNNNNETALHLAVARRMKKVIEFLLKNKAEILKYDEKGNYITHYFIEDEVKKFEKGLNDYVTIYHNRESREKDCADFVEWLISKGFDFDHMNHDGKCALDLAVESNLQNIIPVLLKHTADIKIINKDSKQTLLHSFLRAQRSSTCIKSSDFTRKYDIEIVKFMLDQGVSITADKYGITPIHIAVEYQVKMDIINILINCFTNIHEEGCEKKFLCLSRLAPWSVYEPLPPSEDSAYFICIVFNLSAKGVTIGDATWYGIMKYAIEIKSLRLFQTMKKLGANFRMKTDDGQNLLHVLAESNSQCTEKADPEAEAILDFLISEGCDVNSTDHHKGQTPLHTAISHYKTEITLRKLLEHGADIHVRTDCLEGETPLHLAVKTGRTKVVDLLLDHGADVNSKTYSDRRPIHNAIYNECMVKFLFKRGAYVDARSDLNSQSVLSHYLREDMYDPVQELLQCGANINDQTVIEALTFILSDKDLKDSISWKRFCKPLCVKLKAAKLFYAQEFDHLISNKYYKKLSKKLTGELKKLKSTFIDNQTSLYRMLHMDINSRCIHVGNEKLVNLIESQSIYDDFRHYYIVIMGSYHQAVVRKKLLTPAKEAWYDLTKIYLPDICVERICAFLSNADLVVMIERDEN